MALLGRNAKYLKKFHLPIRIAHAGGRLCVPHEAKLTGYFVLNTSFEPHNHYSTLVNRGRTLRKSEPKYVLSFSSLQSLNYMSTNSNEEKLQFTVSNSMSKHLNEGSEARKDSVYFVESPTVKDSATEIVDNASTQAVEAVSSSSTEVVTDSVAATTDLASVAADVIEPSLASLGLASNWTPVGLVQQLLEFFHVNSYMPMPWWLSIVTGTIVARIAMFPIFVKTQKNAAKFANVMPQLQYLQAKFGEARRSGNAYEAHKAASDIAAYMKKHNVNPLKNALFPMLQAPVFLSFFLALRAMAKLPVESMKEGGFSWITDLTIPDPYYIMPLCACSTLYVVLKIGAESGVRMDNMKMTRYVLTAMPVVLFPFCMYFPSAVLFYWCTNNFLTLGLVLLLKIDRLRNYFGISKIKRPDAAISQKKGFVKGIKDAYEDQKVLRLIEERARMDEMRFRKAGTGPIPRTYSYDPTKPRPAAAAAAATKMHSKTKT